MKLLVSTILCSIIFLFCSCSKDHETFTKNNNEEGSIQSRRTCDGCTVSLTQNGCKLEYTIDERCGEIESVLWTHPGLPNPVPYIGSITASTAGGTYCVEITFSNCTISTCLTIEAGCDELCEDCDLTIEEGDCMLTANAEGCARPVSYTWDIPVSGGRESVPGQSVNIASSGTYCISIVDANGCKSRACIDILEGCDPCEVCELGIIVDEENCILSANVSEDCLDPIQYEWYVDGITSYGSTVSYSSGGTYSLIITDANGCTERELFTLNSCVVDDSCEDCTINFSSKPSSRDIQLTNNLRIDFCNPDLVQRYCAVSGYIFKNDSGCSDSEVISAYQARFPTPIIQQLTLSEFADCIEEGLQTINGCETATVEISKNANDGLDYELNYDCETCNIKSVNSTNITFNMKPDCSATEPSTVKVFSYGDEQCGPCY